MKDYSPPSDFLCMIDFEGTEIRFDGEFGARNLERLIALTRDDHPANRDWATFYLANLEVDSPEVREALLRAATDDHADTRAEAIAGIARRNMPEANSLVRGEL